MIGDLASKIRYCGLDLKPDQSKDVEIYICCFSSEHATTDWM